MNSSDDAHTDLFSIKLSSFLHEIRLEKKAVRERAFFLCEYCYSPERLSANRFTVDHVIPRSLNGSDDLRNLALACRRCNERRYNFVAGIDAETQEVVPIFNHNP